jgi:hypothetical protein
MKPSKLGPSKLGPSELGPLFESTKMNPFHVHFKLGLQRRRQLLLSCAVVLSILDAEEGFNSKLLLGRLVGTKNIKRTRKNVEAMMGQLGARAQRAYKGSLEEFDKLHSILKPYLDVQFGTSNRGRPNGPIPTKLRLSASLRFFCGGAVHDIVLSHGISHPSVYKSAYGVINAVNMCPEMAFNEGGAMFPSHEEQRTIAEGFRKMSAAKFSRCAGPLDGMLVWTKQPTEADCEEICVGQRSFYCHRKSKFGMLLMAICDNKCRFRWADITHPGCASDLTAWLTSDLGQALEKPDQDILLPGHSIFGDNAFVESYYMSTPIPGTRISGYDDAYNFYFSQLRITIERAFGILVHRFAILRAPISMSIKKVPALVMCLMKLHNFYVSESGRKIVAGLEDDEAFIQYRAWRENSVAVSLNKNRVPEDLVGSGHHNRDHPAGKHIRKVAIGGATPMRLMMKSVAAQGLRRPTVTIH